MGSVHQFMNLDPYQLGYFITQVGLSAASFGVSDADVAVVGMALQQHFEYKCAPPEDIVPGAQPQIQAVCVNPACPLAVNATCSLYTNVTNPTYVNGSSYGGGSSSSSSGGSSSGPGSGSGSSGSGAVSGTGAMGGSATATASGPSMVTKNAGGSIRAADFVQVMLTVVVGFLMA